ncbi:MAG: pyruvate, phosphate dikinase, partial [Acidimicrobiia bacterium]|nr:pyruvate, phosphate dikinase [Acidimicrobiia bacterium]
MRYVSDFGSTQGKIAGDLGTRDGALRALTRIGAPVPPGFAISNVACRMFVETGDLPEGAWEQIEAAVARLDAAVAAMDAGRPALLSVRSSAPVDMPALMDAALYLGTNPDSTAAFAQWAGAEAAALAKLRFLETYANVIRGVPVSRIRAITGAVTPTAPADVLDAASAALDALIVEETQRPVPTDRLSQVREGVEAVFASWNARPATAYRRVNGISDETGTGAVVHLMVFGNLDSASGVGVGFSRNPTTGDREASGRYRAEADHPTTAYEYQGLDALATSDPDTHVALQNALNSYERERLDLVRLDYVREMGRLWILEGRVAERTPEAAAKVAVDLVTEGLLTREQALTRLDPQHLGTMMHPRLAPGELPEPIASGSGSSPGAATGVVVLDSDAAIEATAAGESVILVKRETTPEDLVAIRTAAGVLTSHGGRASHAALVARGIGTPAVTGSFDMLIDLDAAEVRWGGTTVKAGETISIDGSAGLVYAGPLSVIDGAQTEDFTTVLSWADHARTLEIWANADTPGDAAAARAAGAEGIGLARTEYMFSGDRLDVVQRIILTTDAKEQADALEQLERLQVGDFERLLEVMDGQPVVVRLLDPPLHEFLPDRLDVEYELAEARALGEPTAELESLEATLDKFEESNPMLGLRGVRLAVVIPEVYKVQVLAALEAVRRRLDAGGDPRLELMIPLVGTVEELHLIRDMIEEEVHNAGRLLEVTIGTMIELPRAALVADEIARESDFFSFGTNDLTQTTMG